MKADCPRLPGIFKPLVLLTPSYAMHIALAEDIPNALREGVVPLVKSVVAGHVAKLGRRIGRTSAGDEQKINAISGLAYDTVTAGMKRAPTRLTKDLQRRLENAAVYLEATGGEAVASGAASMALLPG